MKYERTKTGVLIGLITLSFFLTYQLWTFQPSSGPLAETTQEVVDNDLGEGRIFTELVQPEQIVFHRGEEHSILPRGSQLFTDVYEALLETGLGNQTIMEPAVAGQGIEIIFPDAIPREMFIQLFDLNPDEVSLPIRDVDRLLVYENVESQQVNLQLASNREEQVINIETTMGPTELSELLLLNEEERPAEVVKESESEEMLLRETLYTTVTEETMRPETYRVETMPVGQFNDLLFNEEATRQNVTSDRVYTAGSRMVRTNSNGTFLEYRNPLYSSDPERSSTHIAERAIDYVNSNGGWTDEYALSRWTDDGNSEHAEFRFSLNHVPVYTYRGEGQMIMEVRRVGLQMTDYNRPIFYLNNEPLEEDGKVELPAGVEVMERLQDQPSFELDKLTNLQIGYHMSAPNTSFVSVEPAWFYEYEGEWKRVSFAQENDYELE
ncbi:YycH family regulatory protein [Shouchella shacheensis]|uniref:YycH family regulatory protein n=1 Tax=Shouchella shacheensis TaxID=1649580 RepID=UPI00073FFCAD|nr:two-component system activity regulator YycH [Shouchella shacheensis]